MLIWQFATIKLVSALLPSRFIKIGLKSIWNVLITFTRSTRIVLKTSCEQGIWSQCDKSRFKQEMLQSLYANIGFQMASKRIWLQAWSVNMHTNINKSPFDIIIIPLNLYISRIIGGDSGSVIRSEIILFNR